MNQLNWKEFSLQNKATLGTSQLATRLANMAYLLEKIAQIEQKYFSASILAEQVRALVLSAGNKILDYISVKAVNVDINAPVFHLLYDLDP